MTNAHPKRVVSLIASATEIICALGARNLLVGRSHECDFPPEVTRLPALTEPKFPVTGTSYDIDSRVKAILQEGLSIGRLCVGKCIEENSISRALRTSSACRDTSLSRSARRTR
jgi:hypothetical protein